MMAVVNMHFQMVLMVARNAPLMVGWVKVVAWGGNGFWVGKNNNKFLKMPNNLVLSMY